jgi:hypothetical protein
MVNEKITLWALFIIHTLLGGCHMNNKEDVFPSIVIHNDSLENNSVNVALNLMDTIDSYSIKMFFSNMATTTYMTTDEMRRNGCFIPAENGYFGFYYFFEKNSQNNMVEEAGYMIIFNNQYPWKYGSKNDLLIELVLYSNQIKIQEKLSVGASKEFFLSTLPPPIDEFDTILIFKVGERQYMSVHFEDDKANAIKLIRSQELYNRNSSVFFDLHLL